MRLFVAGLDLTGIHLPPAERRKERDAVWSQARDDLCLMRMFKKVSG